ncbi:MAG: tyrosine-type recombinase/integrase [Nitrospirota bacterium]
MKRALHKTETLKHMTQVSYYSGMRIDEVASLKINNVNFDGGIALCILESKTENGERNIPFGRLAPLEYIEQFKKYYETRKKMVTGDSFLFPQLSYRKQKGGERQLVEKKWTNYASRLVARVFRKHISPDFVFHDLRDSFASLLLFRWFVLFHGDKLPKRPKGLRCYEDDMFSDESLKRLRGLVLGMCNDLKEGQELFTYALAVVARLMGHGGPQVTFKCYLHTTDWLFYFLSRHDKEQRVDLTSDQAISFHQVTYSALPENLRKKGLKTIKVDDFLNGQRLKIKYSMSDYSKNCHQSDRF